MEVNVCEECGNIIQEDETVYSSSEYLGKVLCKTCKERAETILSLRLFRSQFQDSRFHIQNIKKCKEEYELLEKTKPSYDWTNFIMQWILIGLPLILIYTIIVFAILDTSKTKEIMGNKINEALIFTLKQAINVNTAKVLIVVPIVILGITITLKLNDCRNKRIEDKIYKDMIKENLKKTISIEEARLDKLYESTNQYVPRQYSNPLTVTYLLNILIAKRASNLEEAIAIYNKETESGKILRVQYQLKSTAEIITV